jgi:hypothetical protein
MVFSCILWMGLGASLKVYDTLGKLFIYLEVMGSMIFLITSL